MFPVYAQTPVGLLPNTQFQAVDANGKPLVGGQVFTYAAGTTTPLATYTDSSGTVQNTNPVILDTAGRASIWLSNNAYKIVVEDANGVIQWSQDNVTNLGGGVSAPVSVTEGGTGATSLTGVLQGNGTSAVTATPLGNELQVLRVAPNTTAPTLGFGSLAINNANDYTFTQVPGGTLTGGTPATVTLAPCPLGAVAGDFVYISGGTGTAEPVTITGGTCTSGASTGTVQFTPLFNHSGSWLIGSATGGIMEAVCALPAAGGEVTINNPITLQQSVGYCGKTNVRIFKNAGQTITSGPSGPFNILGTLSTSSGEERYGSLSQADSGLGQSAYGMIYLNPASQNVPNEYNIISTIYAGDTALPNALTRVAGYFFAQTGLAGIDTWGTNIGVTMEVGAPKVNVQGIELDFNNRSGFAYALHDAKAGNGISVIDCCPSGAYQTGAAGISITDTGGASPGWQEGIHITPGAVKLIGLDLDGTTVTTPVTAAFLQLANADPIVTLRRVTDTSPTGHAVRLVNAAYNADLYDLDVNGEVSTYNGLATAGQGLSSVVGTASITAQSASKTSTPFTPTLPTGLYRACMYANTNTAGTGNVTSNIIWTDSVSSKSSSLALGLTANTFQQSCTSIQVAASTTINYSAVYTGTGAYNLYVTAERLQ